MLLRLPDVLSGRRVKLSGFPKIRKAIYLSKALISSEVVLVIGVFFYNLF